MGEATVGAREGFLISNEASSELKPLATTPNMVQLRPKGHTDQERLEGSGGTEGRTTPRNGGTW